jgi:hypothetical protein
MKMVMFTEKDPMKLMYCVSEPGNLAFVYRHPKSHRLVFHEVDSWYVPGLISLLQTHSLVDALDSTDGDRQQDWRGRSPLFSQGWREAYKNSPANSDLIIRLKLIDPEYAQVA